MLSASVGLAAAAVVLGAASFVSPVPPGGAHAPPEPPAPGTYAWPVDGPVIRPFEAPLGPFSPGHRGIDIAADPGTPVRAPERGRVTFAGTLAGSLYVTIEHPDGVRTSSSWLSAVAVRRGDEVARGQIVGATGAGHPGGSEEAHLHFGARIGDVYIDPLLLLERRTAGLVHLAPVEDGAAP